MEDLWRKDAIRTMAILADGYQYDSGFGLTECAFIIITIACPVATLGMSIAPPCDKVLKIECRSADLEKQALKTNVFHRVI